jgi:bacteriorhodopsin
MNSFIRTYYLSLAIQFVTFFIQLYGYLLPTNQNILPLKYALNAEFFVSIVEFVVYLWIAFSLSNLNTVMRKRYIDWFITTNSMLISLCLLFTHYNQEENIKTINKNNTYDNLITKNISTFIPILIFNTMMLAIGYLGEKNIIPLVFSFSVGFVFFAASFYYIYKNFAQYSQSGQKVFLAITTIWALYGIAHLLGKIGKNTAYNILDLISKNTLGVFLVYSIYNKVKS